MKAAIFHDQGGVDVLRYEDVSDPTPDPNEVVVRLHASALNRLDLKAREGRPEVAPMPHIGGLDGAGEIAELGANVKGWRVGDRVVIVPILSCGACDLCISGDNALCDQQKVFGFQTNGSFAEYVAVPSYNLVRVPTGVDLQSLAAIPCAYLTAWRMVVGKAKVREGETVLIHSVGSGVGSAALQIAKYLGARAIGTASLDTKLDGAKRMGADVVGNYR
ncbi:MAG: alcohol dehydrogenase catalytic domain-containing protein, partial [Candidatus Poribacteria bacterium]|nr:alcohol dehydrogenase catalytic domain-containing protein [Candidatus Poribacteria bacterium]